MDQILGFEKPSHILDNGITEEDALLGTSTSWGLAHGGSHNGGGRWIVTSWPSLGQWNAEGNPGLMTICTIVPWEIIETMGLRSSSMAFQGS